MLKLLSFLTPGEYITPLQDKHTIKKMYKYWRTQLVIYMCLGYSCFYMARKSFTCLMPLIANDLDLTKAKLGLITTSLYISYAISKLLSGILADRSNPRYFMAFGLMLSGALNVIFGLCSSFAWFVVIWFLNGIFQAWGWPAITKILTYWFEKKQRGRWWSVCNLAHNLGGGLFPVFLVFMASCFSWRIALLFSGTLSILMGFVLINRLQDVPQTLGLPAIPEAQKHQEQKHSCGQAVAQDVQQSTDAIMTVKDILFKQVLSNPNIWILALCYLSVYVLRMALADWGILYFVEEKQYSITVASYAILFFEVGGFVGVLTGGFLSDKIFKGNRLPYCLFCFLITAIFIITVWHNPINIYGIDFIYMAILGFFIFGPQMLVGLAASEGVDKKAAATANGFVGLFAYLGAACTGMPLGIILDKWSWISLFYVLLIATVLGAGFISIVLVNQISKQKKNKVSANISYT